MIHKDYSKNKKCIDCKKKITNKAIRCQNCVRQVLSGSFHYLFNKHPSKNTRLKMSEAGKKKIFTDEHKQNMSKACRNRPIMTLKIRQKISNTLKGRTLLEVNHKINCSCSFCKAQRKELINHNNPNWRGGISKFPYSFKFTIELKEIIRQRDNFTCQYCGMTEEEHLKKYNKILYVHHIDYDKENCKEDNLITLCSICNSKVNYNRDYYYAYFTYIMEKICLN